MTECSAQNKGFWWQPDHYSHKIPFLQKRAKLLSELRSYFSKLDFLEVETPALQRSPGIDVHLKAFKTKLDLPHLSHINQTYYLHTSPEFAMKKLLVAGLSKIIQISHSYRNEAFSPLHSPEFTLIEWYRALAYPASIMQDCEAMIQQLARAIKVCKIGDCALFIPWERLSVYDAFQLYVGVDIHPAFDGDPLNPKRSFFQKLAKNLKIHVSDQDSWEDLFFRIFLKKIEPHLGQKAPCFLTDYPIAMACLARTKEKAPHLAERFELYIAGVELANGFYELTDPKIQQRRFERDLKMQKKLYGTSLPIDKSFLKALECGMPESSGVALGFDRLVMLLVGASNIHDIMWAPVEIEE